MMARKHYNGYPSWNAWNVALWIGNDETLYYAAIGCIKLYPNKQKTSKPYTRAARMFIKDLGLTRTPDGAKYTINSVRLALEGLT